MKRQLNEMNNPNGYPVSFGLSIFHQTYLIPTDAVIEMGFDARCSDGIAIYGHVYVLRSKDRSADYPVIRWLEDLPDSLFHKLLAVRVSGPGMYLLWRDDVPSGYSVACMQRLMGDPLGNTEWCVKYAKAIHPTQSGAQASS